MSNDINFIMSRIKGAKHHSDTTRVRRQILKNSENYEDLSNIPIEKIAGLHNGYREFKIGLEDSLLVLGNGKKQKSKNIYKNDETVGKTVYSKLNSNDNNFFKILSSDLEQLTANVIGNQSGQQLTSNVININNITQVKKINYNRTAQSGMVDFQNLYKANKNFNNILKHGGQIITYDTETLGGINSYGHQQVDFITELSASVWDIDSHGIKKDIKPKETISSLLGFSDAEYKKTKKYIEGLAGKSPQELTGMDIVYIKRLSLLNDPTMKISQNGFEHRITKSNPDDVVGTVENALKGLEEYRKIGKQQEAHIGNNISLEDYKKQYIKQYKDLVYNGIGLDGTKYDNRVAIGQNSAMFDDKVVGEVLGETVEHEAGKGLDVYQMIKYMQENLGQSSHIPEGYKATNKHGLASQDQLKGMLKLDKSKVGAHNALEDENSLFHILTDKLIKSEDGTKSSYGKFLSDNMYEVEQKLSNLKSSHQVTGKNDRPGIFLMDKTAQKDWSSNKDGLSFTYNPLDKSYKTYDGFKISSDGNIVKEDVKGFGPKANALYTHKAYKVDLNSDAWKESFSDVFGKDQMERFYEQYSNLDYIYVLQSKEYINKKVNKEKFGENNVFEEPKTHVRILTSEDQLATAMGTKIAYANKNGTESFIDEAIEALDFKTTGYDEHKNVVIKDVDKNEAKKMILDRSAYTTSADGAARKIRDMEYDKIAKLYKYKQANNLSVSQRISELVSTNSTLTTDITQNLIEELGYTDFKTNTKKLYPETVANANVLDKYADALSPIFDIMEDVFENDMGIKKLSTVEKEIGGVKRQVVEGATEKAIKAKKNIVFKDVITNVLEAINSDPNFINNYKPTIFSAKELNRIDFLKSDLFPKAEKRQMGRSVSNENGKYISLDLTKNDALLNMFFNNEYKNVDVSKKTNAGFDSLFKAYDVIGSDERFAGVWGDLTTKELMSYQKEGNLSQLNSIMIEKLQKHVSEKRERDSGFGLKHARFVQDFSNVDELKDVINHVGKQGNTLRDLVSDIMHSSIDDVYIADEKSDKLINDVVNKYFMTFSEDELNEQIKDLTKDQQKVLKAQYEISKKQAETSAKDLIESIKNTDINFGIHGTGKDATLFLQRGTEVQALDMHQYVLNNGIINHRINGTDHATNFAYDVSSVINRQGQFTGEVDHVMRGVKVTSNVEAALNRTGTITQTVKHAEKGERDIFDTIVGKIKKNAGILREVGPRKENNNYNNNIERAMHIDVNALVGILPELESGDFINQINKDFKIDSKSSADMKKLIQKIRDSKKRPREIKELLSSEQGLLYQVYLSPLISSINKNLSSKEQKDLVKTINPHTQDTSFAKGVMTLNNSPFSHGAAKFDPTSRSVAIQQGNSILYNKKKLLEDINDFGLKDRVTVGGKLMTAASNKYVKNSGDYTAGITLKYLQIDSHSLRNIFVEDVDKVRNGEDNKFTSFLTEEFKNKGYNIDLEKASHALAEKAMNLSTYEQQSAINARVSYAAFHKNNSQLIDGKKAFIVSHKQNLSTIEATKNAHKLPFIIKKDGKIQYQLGYEVKKGQVLGAFGSEQNIVESKFEGIFRARYFDKYGEVVSEETLQSLVAQHGDIKKLKEGKLLSILNSEYDLKYQVINKFEDYGHKIYNDASEKSTADVMDVAIGKVDSYVAQSLKDTGFGDLNNTVLSRQYIEEYLTPELKRKAKTNPNINPQYIIDRMLKERFSFSDSLSAFDILKDVDQITNLNTIKHTSVSMGLTNLVENLNKSDDTKNNVNKYYDAIFGKNKYTVDQDGTIIMDDVNSLTVSNFNKDYKKFGLSKKEGSILQKIINEQDFIRDENDKVIGHKGYSYVTHANDHQAGTHSSNLDITNLQRDYFKIEEKMRTTTDEKELTKYTNQLSAIDNKIHKINTQKGLSFDDNMNLNLQRAVYDNDSIGLARTKLSEEEFKEYFGHATKANGKVSDEYLGKRVLDPVTSILRERSMIGFGERQLSSVTKAEKHKYKHLLKSFDKMKDDISIEKAEKAYSYLQGVKALDFNTSKEFSHSMFEELTEGHSKSYNNFKLVDLKNASLHDNSSWLDLDIGGQGKTVTSAANNPYTHNLMIKTGLGGKEEYLAIARMPERHFDDSLIKQNHIQKLNELQRTLQQIKGGNLTEDELKNNKSYARRIVNDIIAGQKHDLTSKTGLYGDLISSRLSQSFFGKASGLTINSDKSLKELQELNKDDLKGYKYLQKKNGKTFLDVAEVGGKTLLQHYSEGKVIDAVGVSKKAFEDMGYFNDDMIRKVFGKQGTKEKMEEYLTKYGDTFISTRFPRIQEASDKVVFGFLDSSLKGNQIRALGHTGSSMNLDHDGDSLAIGRITNNKGESYLDYMAKGLEPDDFIKSQKAMVMERAVNANHYWDNKIRNHVGKEMKVAITGNRIQDIAKDRIIDNKVFSAIMDSKDITVEKMASLLDTYQEDVTKAMQYKGDGNAHEDIIKKLKETHGEGAAFNQAKKEYATAYSYQLMKDEIIAKASRNSIGEINSTNAKVKSVATALMDTSADNYAYKSRLMFDMMHLSEQAAISSKSSIEGLSPDRASIWNNSVEGLLKKKGDAQTHIDTMNSWSKKYLVKDMDYDYYWNTSGVFQERAAKVLNGGKSLTEETFHTLIKDKGNEEKLQNAMVEDFTQTLSSLRDIDGIDKALEQKSFGHSATGVTRGLTTPVSIKGFQNPSDVFIDLLKSADKDTNKNLKFIELEQKARESKFSGPNIIDRVVSNVDDVAEKPGIGRQILEGANDLFKGVKGSKIAMGAVGIAAGVMMLGYVGGRPRPADTHAMEEAQDYQEPQQGLMDPGMMPMSQGGQQGYVININARSDKGKNHVVSALQQAIASGTSSSVNISMNINDNYGNINDRDIQNAIKDAL